MPEALIIKDLELFYQRVRICGPVNCQFSRGKINLIVGRAGSGKSTLLRSIAGFHNETRGSIFLDSDAFKPDGQIALAFQNPENLFFNPTVGEEVCFALIQSGETAQASLSTGKNWLEKWGLLPDLFWDKHPLELSGGEKRKVALSACTALLPPVIMLDEPMAGLDHPGQLKLISILREIAHDHIVIVVTHDPEILFPISSGILYLMKDGAGFFTVDEFVRQAVMNADFFPLPDWYRKVLEQHSQVKTFPKISGEAVHHFLEGVETDADYICPG